MPDIKLNIVNQALTAAGEDPLTSLTPGSVMANAALENYDAIVGEELENGAWKFATRKKAPTLLTATVNKPLKYQWQLPADCTSVLTVRHCGVDLDGEDYEIEGRILLTKLNADIEVKYIWSVPESVWPQRFQRIIAQRLEALFLRVSERHSEAEARDNATTVKTMIARHTEARQRRNRPLGDGSIAQARTGRGRLRRSF